MKADISSRVQTSLASALNIRTGEERLVLLPVLLFFLKGICDVFYATSAGTLFLKEFGNVSLPKVYILSAGLVTIFGLAYSFLSTRISVLALLRITVVFSVLTIGMFHFALTWLGSGWWAMGLMVWREVPYMLLNVVFWAQAGLLFNVRQSKRVFPLIAAGDIASAAIGGIAIPFIVAWIGPLHLLFFAEISIALCLLVSIYLGRLSDSHGVQMQEDLAAAPLPLSKLVQDRYVALFMGMSVVSFVIYFFADYNFYDVVNGRYQEAEALAAFLGIFYAVLNGFNLVLNGAIAGRVLKRFGTYTGLLVLPVCVGIATVAALVLSGFGISAAIFWAIIGTKLVDEMLRGAFLIPTFKILFQPLPDRERLRVQSVRDSVVEPAAIGFSGLLLLLLTQNGFQRMQLLWVLLGLLVVFVVMSVFLRGQYIVVLNRALLGWKDAPEPRSLSGNVDTLKRALESLNPDEAIDSFLAIKHADPTAAKLLLPQILKHPLAEVRLHGLRQIQESRETRATGLVRSLLEIEESPAVKSEALRTLSLLTGENTPE